MLNIFDVVREPVIEDVESVVTSTPWILAYVVVGTLFLVATLIVIKLIIKTNKNK